MLKECLEVFGEVLAKERQKGKDIILDSYIPADGIRMMWGTGDRDRYSISSR